jgi:transcriptional antiterminator NusG
VDHEVGEHVRVVSGPFEDFELLITEVNAEKHKIKGLVNMFGRETSVELDFNQIEKLD